VTESYRYDGLGRLVGAYDNEGKKVEGYEYNYQNR
jgi:YD repeat-containing protein